MDKIDAKKRKTLVGTTTVAFGVGAGFVCVPFLSSMSPSEKAKAAGAPVEVNLKSIKAGKKITITWRGTPVIVARRSEEALRTINSLNPKVLDPNSSQSKQPSYCQNTTRSIAGHEEFFVAIALCTHLGCIPSYRPEAGKQDFNANWQGGFYCPCHGSVFDLAGRVYPGVPAPTNLSIPPYYFASDTKLIIGIDQPQRVA